MSRMSSGLQKMDDPTNNAAGYYETTPKRKFTRYDQGGADPNSSAKKLNVDDDMVVEDV